jgi:hypothetical protein
MQIAEKNEHSTLLLFLLLLSTDFFFIILHVIINHTSPDNFDGLFLITTDRGYGEFFMYIKLAWIILLFAYILLTKKCIGYIAWIVVFTYFLVDDSLQIHETIGEFVSMRYDFQPFFHLRKQDFGELTASATAGAFLFAILSYAYLRAVPRFKKISIDLGFLVLVLVFFGVFVDMAHVIFQKWIDLGLVEDGGEKVTISIILWYVYALAVRKEDSDLYLVDILRKGFNKSRI